MKLVHYEKPSYASTAPVSLGNQINSRWLVWTSVHNRYETAYEAKGPALFETYRVYE